MKTTTPHSLLSLMQTGLWCVQSQFLHSAEQDHSLPWPKEETVECSHHDSLMRHKSLPRTIRKHCPDKLFTYVIIVPIYFALCPSATINVTCGVAFMDWYIKLHCWFANPTSNPITSPLHPAWWPHTFMLDLKVNCPCNLLCIFTHRPCLLASHSSFVQISF